MGVTAGIFLASILLKEMRYLVYIRYLWLIYRYRIRLRHWIILIKSNRLINMLDNSIGSLSQLKGRFTIHNFWLKLWRATCLQLELYYELHHTQTICEQAWHRSFSSHFNGLILIWKLYLTEPGARGHASDREARAQFRRQSQFKLELKYEWPISCFSQGGGFEVGNHLW
jgi:hypothetical protein